MSTSDADDAKSNCHQGCTGSTMSQVDGEGETSSNDQETTSDVARDVCKVFSIFFAVLVRAVLILFCLAAVWLVEAQLGNRLYWLLTILCIPMVIEGIHIIITRAGQERKWLCLCFVFYLCATVPSIWLLELDRLSTFEHKYDQIASHPGVTVSGISWEWRLDPSVTLSIAEQSLIFLLILCRWLLPRGDITRDQLSQLLFVFIGMASDVMELFELFDESEVRQDRPLTFVILAVWTISLYQFTMVLTMIDNPKRPRVALNHSLDKDTVLTQHKDEEKEQLRVKGMNLCQLLLSTEIWSLIVTICMQDGPFLAVRLFTLIRHRLINYSIIFFTCKNVLVIMLLIYRLIVIFLERMENTEEEEEGEENKLKKITIPKDLLDSSMGEKGSNKFKSLESSRPASTSLPVQVQKRKVFPTGGSLPSSPTKSSSGHSSGQRIVVLPKFEPGKSTVQ